MTNKPGQPKKTNCNAYIFKMTEQGMSPKEITRTLNHTYKIEISLPTVKARIKEKYGDLPVRKKAGRPKINDYDWFIEQQAQLGYGASIIKTNAKEQLGVRLSETMIQKRLNERKKR